MTKLLVFLVAATAIQLILVWAIAHLGVLVLGACAWGAWSWWRGQRDA